MVGRIENHHQDYVFSKGEEKGMFKYGGSTVMILIKKGVVDFDRLIFRATQSGEELPVKIGQKIGTRSEAKDV